MRHMQNVVTGVGLLTGFLGICITIYYARKADASDRRRKRLDWPDVQSAARDLTRRIKADFSPAAILTPGLSGATLANLMAFDFSEQPPVYVGIRTWKDDPYQPFRWENAYEIETKKWLVWIPKPPELEKEGPILIVDDFAMSGDFLDQLKNLMVADGVNPNRIRSATIAVTKVAVKNRKAPDYWWWQADDDDFFFPWGRAK